MEGWEQGRGRTVHFIDWDHPYHNTFRAVNQFKVACPAGQADKHIIPDVVLFVNGVPLVVVEAKSPFIRGAAESGAQDPRAHGGPRGRIV